MVSLTIDENDYYILFTIIFAVLIRYVMKYRKRKEKEAGNNIRKSAVAAVAAYIKWEKEFDGKTR